MQKAKAKQMISRAMAVILTLSAGNVSPVLAAVPTDTSPFSLSLDEPYLTSGNPQKLYLESRDDLAIKSVDYAVTGDNSDKIEIDPVSGTILLGGVHADRE